MPITCWDRAKQKAKQLMAQGFPQHPPRGYLFGEPAHICQSHQQPLFGSMDDAFASVSRQSAIMHHQQGLLLRSTSHSICCLAEQAVFGFCLGACFLQVCLLQ